MEISQQMEKVVFEMVKRAARKDAGKRRAENEQAGEIRREK